MRVHFVDGPLNGTTMHVETADREYYCADSSILAVNPDRSDRPIYYTHKYQRMFQTYRDETIIYEYVGLRGD